MSTNRENVFLLSKDSDKIASAHSVILSRELKRVRVVASDYGMLPTDTVSVGGISTDTVSVGTIIAAQVQNIARGDR